MSSLTAMARCSPRTYRGEETRAFHPQLTVPYVLFQITGCVLHPSRYQPDLLARAAYLEPTCFFAGNTKFWPAVFARMDAAELWRRLCGMDAGGTSQGGLRAAGPIGAAVRGGMWAVFGGEAHQLVIHSACWFFDYCHREGLSALPLAPRGGAAGAEREDGQRAGMGAGMGGDSLVVLAGADPLVPSATLRRHFASWHPHVGVLWLGGAPHGGSINPLGADGEATMGRLERHFAAHLGTEGGGGSWQEMWPWDSRFFFCKSTLLCFGVP